MNKLVRRIAAATASLVLVGGALLTAGGSATAATLPADARIPARAGVVAETQTTGGHNDGYAGDGNGNGQHSNLWDRQNWNPDTYNRFYPWIWDQFKLFGYDNQSSPHTL
ncbi:hypothetical protein ACWERW_10980 [Streptomyces sp. NPDC004012]